MRLTIQSILWQLINEYDLFEIEMEMERQTVSVTKKLFFARNQTTSVQEQCPILFQPVQDRP